MGWHTIGNEKATGALRRALDGGRLPHALLITGPEHVGKMALAVDLASALNCTGEEKLCGECPGCSRTRRGLHTDVHVVGLEMAAGGGRSRTLIGVDQVRDVQREAALAPFEGACRVIVFDGAELMSEEAANSLLKTLEEPPPGVYLLLLTPKPEALLPTVVSRCQVVDLKPVPSDVIARHLVESLGMDEDLADRTARLSGGRPGWAIRAAAEPELLEAVEEKVDVVEEVVKGSMETRFEHAARLGSATDRDRESGRRELEVWLAWWRDVMLIKEGAPQLAANLSRMESLKAVAAMLTRQQITGAIQAIRRTRRLITRNVNSRLALEVMMLDIPRVRQQ
jgi:DNA polymerase-3 subunit delta'